MTFKVSSVQFQHRANDKPYNLARIVHFTNEAIRAGSQLVAFPEMCICGYGHVPKLDSTDLHTLAEPLSGPSVSYLAAMAQEKGIAIGAGFLEQADDQFLYKSYVVCMPDGRIHCHRKLHAWEHRLISSGNTYRCVGVELDWALAA